MRRTALIVISFVAVTAWAGIVLTKRLVSTEDKGTSSGAVALTSGRGITVKVSDHPMAMPALNLTDLDGKPVTPQAWAGKVVLLNFWATWCGPCREEIPTLVALQKHYREQLVVVGLSIDSRPPAEVKQFTDQFFVNYPVAMADEKLEEAFGGISAVPSTFVLDTKGRIVQRHVGGLDPQLTEHEVRALSGLPTEATIQTVKDTGQVLLANAAFATEIPGVDMAGMTPNQKEACLQRMNTEHCTCGCGLTIAQCRINDPTCDVSLPIAQALAKEFAAKKP